MSSRLYIDVKTRLGHIRPASSPSVFAEPRNCQIDPVSCHFAIAAAPPRPQHERNDFMHSQTAPRQRKPRGARPRVPRSLVAQDESRRLLEEVLSPWRVTRWDANDFGICASLRATYVTG